MRWLTGAGARFVKLHVKHAFIENCVLSLHAYWYRAHVGASVLYFVWISVRVRACFEIEDTCG